MKQPSKRLLKVDLIIQSLLIFPTTIAMAAALVDTDAAIFGFFIMFFLGCWQVLSGFVFGLVYGSRKRAAYILFVLLFLLIAGILTSVISQMAINNYNLEMLLGIVGWIIIPMGIALWYYHLTSQEVSNYDEIYSGTEIQKIKGMDDVLDSEELRNV